MTQKAFLNNITNGKNDIIRELIDAMDQNNINYCVIGGLAVNAYVEPVVSLDLDIVVITQGIDELLASVKNRFTVAEFPHSINLSSKDSDIRIQIQSDERYQDFIRNASVKEVMGYKMKTASLEDVLKGKIWAYSDTQRLGSKRQKDLADIMRIIESFPELKSQLPDAVIGKISNL